MSTFIDVAYTNRRKFGMSCSGDSFVSRRVNGGARSCAVLADGLGSGLQANAASSLTATMALEYIAADVNIKRAAEMIMDALPLCPDRHIPYSTFTMVNADIDGSVKLIEFGNPQASLFREGEHVELHREKYTLPRWTHREAMTYSTFKMQIHDRLVFCSDGVTQSGLGTEGYPFGWGNSNLRMFVSETLKEDPSIPAAELSRRIVGRGLHFDNAIPGDDISAAVIDYRDTRILQVLTGPPFSKAKDEEYASQILNPGTTSVVCGGTTSEIVARTLKRDITMSLDSLDPNIPATSTMQGVELVTEGCITLSATADLLESQAISIRENGATKLRDLMLSHDRIVFLVGTGLNPANHAPDLPVELEFRRTLTRRLKKILEKQYFKEVIIRYY